MRYYETSCEVRYRDEKAAKKWKEPPHYYLANVQLSTGLIRGFATRFGLPYREWRWEGSQRHRGKRRGSWVLNKPDVEQMQKLLRRAWQGEIDAIADIEKGDPNYPGNRVIGEIKIDWSIGRKGIVATALDLWSFIRIAFLQDYAAGRTKVCENQDCPSPFFLQARKGQKYCSHKCAVLINVRRFRKRLATRGVKSSHHTKSGKRS